MVAKALRAVLLGAPGSGKGTQAERLAVALGVPTISTGEVLRRAVAQGTELGSRVEKVMASGRLVDDDLMADVVRARLREGDCASGFLLDGYPRTLAQAETLDRILGEAGEALDAVVLFEVPEERLIQRALARKREDDQEPVIRHRLKVYHEKTEPLIELYRTRGILHSIDGDRPIEMVSRASLSVLRGA